MSVGGSVSSDSAYGTTTYSSYDDHGLSRESSQNSRDQFQSGSNPSEIDARMHSTSIHADANSSADADATVRAKSLQHAATHVQHAHGSHAMTVVNSPSAYANPVRQQVPRPLLGSFAGFVHNYPC